MNCLDSTRDEPDKLKPAICPFLFMGWGVGGLLPLIGKLAS